MSKGQKRSRITMRTRAGRRVQRQGISFQGAWYGHVLLAGYRDRRVWVRFDPSMPDVLAVFDRTDRLICVAGKRRPVDWEALASEGTPAPRHHAVQVAACSVDEVEELVRRLVRCIQDESGLFRLESLGSILTIQVQIQA